VADAYGYKSGDWVRELYVSRQREAHAAQYRF
jgi:hypothetical protein